jgi:hypothetical protein
MTNINNDAPLTSVTPAATPIPPITRVLEITLLNANKAVDVETFKAAFAINPSGFIEEIFSVCNVAYGVRGLIESLHTPQAELEELQSRLENKLIT